MLLLCLAILQALASSRTSFLLSSKNAKLFHPKEHSSWQSIQIKEEAASTSMGF
jgi:hypothetical protein